MDGDVGKTKVICVPFAGSGASFFRPWIELSGRIIEIIPVQLPGRERRIDEEPLQVVGDAVDDLLAKVMGVVERPARVAVFGHSLGAVLAFELAHRLVELPGIELCHLFVSGSPEPGVPREQRATGLADDEFLERVAEFAGFKHEALQREEVRELVLPAMRSDVAMHESYSPTDPQPLAVPITALRGSEDMLVSADEAAAWSKMTSQEFSYREFLGGHMYLVDSAPSVVRLMTETLV